MTTMTVAQFPAANAALELVTREVPEPGAGQVLLRVRACGICHSDLFVQGGAFPGLKLPRVPGHEVAAVVERVGPGVRPWRTGDRVGIGWHVGHCFVCDSCRVGDFITCREGQITGFAYDGGYGEYMVARAEALARIPDTLGDVEAAPLLCAGITTFNALRNSPARPGDLVAVQGLGAAGQLLLLGAVAEPLAVSALPLISLRQSIRGWPSGHAKDSEDTLRFAAATGIRPMVETFPLARANEAFARMVSGKARFRVVLTMG